MFANIVNQQGGEDAEDIINQAKDLL